MNKFDDQYIEKFQIIEDIKKIRKELSQIDSLVNTLFEKLSSDCKYKKVRNFFWLGEHTQGSFNTCIHEKNYMLHYPNEVKDGKEVTVEKGVAWCDLERCPLLK